MPYHSTICAAVLLFPLFCAEHILAQDVPPPNDKHSKAEQISMAGESMHHRCFEQPHGALEAIHRLPSNDRYWLQEDAVYIITPEERCAFLHLENDPEREQFIEQFWYRRSFAPISLDYDFKTEHYRRIVFANEEYGSQLAGWKTDRGKIYVLFGPPDSVDSVADQRTARTAPNQDSSTDLHPAEKWRYYYVKGIGENVEFHFEFVTRYADYALATPDQNLLERADLNPDRLPMTPENIQLYVAAEPPPKIRFKDLEALVVSQMVRDQVKFNHRVEFAPATHATTLARIHIQIPCEACTHAGQVVPSLAYPLFIRVSKPSGWVVDTSELTAEMATHDTSNSAHTLSAHFDVPLAPGTYQLAIAVKNTTTGDAGIVRTQLEVPTYELLLGTKN